jgi:CheY-like chemotaxis protein
MFENRILIAEDDESTRELLSKALSSKNFKVTLTQNGQEALDEFKKNPFRVVIVDIEMPVMDGRELINHLKDFDDEPIILITTSHQEAQIIIDVMKMGVYDYLLKPLDIKKLLLNVKQAFEIYELRRTKNIVDKEKIIRLERQLEWARWKDKIEAKERTIGNMDQSIFYNLKTSFAQGAGIGALVTLLKMLSGSAKKEGKNYLINGNIMNMVFENTKMADEALNLFSEIDKIISEDLEMEKISCAELHKEVTIIKDTLSDYTAFKSQNIILSKPKKTFKERYILINREYFKRAIGEVLINAMKFSEKNSEIIILLESKEKDLMLSVINKPSVDAEGREGIPIRYENIIFEPFFKMSKTVHEDYMTLDFGLGLTVVENIIKKHNGEVSISNIKDYTDLSSDPVIKVILSISFPTM